MIKGYISRTHAFDQVNRFLSLHYPRKQDVIKLKNVSSIHYRTEGRVEKIGREGEPDTGTGSHIRRPGLNIFWINRSYISFPN